MGAVDFVTMSHGKTVQDAFRAAVEEARWEHGHGGYSGTIAEKHDFVLFDLPPRVQANKVLAAVQSAWARNDTKPTQHRSNARKSWKWLVDKFGERTANEMERIYNDKWGPCLTFVVTGQQRDRYRLYNHVGRGHKVYLFAGFAPY